MKAIKITILLLFLTGTIYAQNCCESGDCYIRLDDISGVDTDEYQDSLQAAACRLVQAFPEDFRRDFRVYDFGFYLHNENFDGSYPEVFEQVKSQIDKPYYLLFGKQTDSKGVYSKIWVELKLPTTGNFECFTSTQYNLMQNTLFVKVESEYRYFNKIPTYFAKSEIFGMEYLKQRIIEMVECCQSTARNPDDSCSGCPNADDILTYYESEGYDAIDISIITDDFGLPIQLEPLSNPNIEDFAKNVYQLNGRNIDPFSEIEAELTNLGLNDLALGIILNNSSLCSVPAVETYMRSNSDALTLFNNEFNVEGKILVIVYHIWQNPDGSGNDKLLKKFLWANRGSLHEIDIPLNPTQLGVGTVSDYNYELTDLEECTEEDYLYEVKKDENGVYYGYELVNCEWQKKDIVEFIAPDPYPANPNDEQYQIGSQITPTKTTEIRTRLRKEFGVLVSEEYEYDIYFPCEECYEYSVGSKKEISTNDLIRNFYGPYETGWTHQAEKDILFNSFVYGKGQPVVWNAESSISENLRENERVQENITRIESEIREWVEQNGDLDGLINSNDLIVATDTNPTFTMRDLPNLWPTEMFGGIQGRSVKIVRFQQKYSSTCPANKKIICEFVYTLYDNFGLDSNEGIWLPGMAEQWVLQHYRNGYCCGYKAFSPVVKHQVEFHHSFEMCIE